MTHATPPHQYRSAGSVGVAGLLAFVFSLPSPASELDEPWVMPELELEDPRLLHSGSSRKNWDAGAAGASAMAASIGSGGLGGVLGSNWATVGTTVTGEPGASGSMLGLGRRGDDVAVKLESGVPLDPPQGGGFDLNSVPVFLWSGAAYSNGAADLAGSSVQRASGTLTLKPWVEQDLPRATIVSGGAGTLGVGQFAAGHRWAPGSGVLAGWLFGRQSGAAVSLHARQPLSGAWEVSAGVLGSVLSADLEGSMSYPTPTAVQSTQRWVPSVQWTRQSASSPEPLFRLTLNGDLLGLDYQDPEHDLETADASRKLRAALDFGWVPEQRWHLEVSESQLEQKLPEGAAGTHRQGAGSVAWSARWTGVAGSLWEPQVRAVALEGVGVHPELSLRVWAFEGGDFVEASWTRKFPTLLDRYYQFPPFFSGNPDLQPEGIATLRAGSRVFRFFDGRLNAGLEATFQGRRNLILSSGFDTPTNGGDAWVTSFEPYWGLQGSSDRTGWSFSQRLSMTYSSLEDEAGRVGPIPLQPSLRGGATLGYSVARWEVEASLRGSSPIPTEPGASLPAFVVASLGMNWRLSRGGGSLLRGADLSIRVDDLLDRKPEQIPDFQGPGRAFSVALSADLD